jgi:dUTP pyrophosphatase
MLVKIKKLDEKAVIPKYAKKGDAGLDLVSTSYEFVDGRHVYGTGLAIEIPEGFVGLIFPRSSICKYDLRLSNSVGVIDSGYRGEIKFQFENEGFGLCVAEGNSVEVDTMRNPKIYEVGDRVGQLLIVPYPKIEFIETKHLSETTRATGGFGSTGK